MNAILAALLYMVAAQTDEPRAEFYYDFRKGEVAPELILLNPRDEQLTTLEPEGVRLKLPRERKNVAPIVGVKRSERLGGDFEVTATFEILEAEVPPKGFGVGVSLFVQKAEPSPDGAGIYRLVKPGGNGKQVIYWDRSIHKEGEEPRFEGGAVPCLDTVGRLRIKRVGNILHLLWAPGTQGEDFQQVGQTDFGLDDIKGFSMRGMTGKQASALDARFLDLRVRSGKPIVPAPDNVAAPPARGRSLWWLAMVAAVVVVLIIAVAVRRRAQRQVGTTIQR